MLTSHLLAFGQNINQLITKLTRTSLGLSNKCMPVVLQAEITECGLAALAMLLGYYGTHVTLEEMRQAVGDTRLGVSLLT